MSTMTSPDGSTRRIETRTHEQRGIRLKHTVQFVMMEHRIRQEHGGPRGIIGRMPEGLRPDDIAGNVVCPRRIVPERVGQPGQAVKPVVSKQGRFRTSIAVVVFGIRHAEPVAVEIIIHLHR